MDKPQFVIQEHRTPDGIHWDLMLQRNHTLWTWRMSCRPAEIGDTPLPLEKIADHPMRFLTYEGPVKHKTGSVRIADEGTCEMIAESTDTIRVNFQGEHLNGCFTLSRTALCDRWTLTRQ